MNSRNAFGVYTISNRAPSTKLGDSSVRTILFRHPQRPYRLRGACNIRSIRKLHRLVKTAVRLYAIGKAMVR